jgi:imidazolonepropionase-like amidohydrolase
MNLRILPGPCAAVCILALGCGGAQPPSATLAIRGAAVVDVRDGSLHPNQTVLVDGRRIVGVGPADEVAIPDGVDVVDGTGGYLIPGLWDMHAHAFMDSPETEQMIAGIPVDRDRPDAWRTFYGPTLDVLLANGVTGIREMWGDRHVLAAVRAEHAAGALTSPRFVAAGHFLSGPGVPFPGTTVVSDPAAARMVVDSLAGTGADFIKVSEGLTLETYEAIVDQARRRGLAVAGHVPEGVGLAAAADAGQRSIEHTPALLDCGVEPPADTSGPAGELDSGDTCRRIAERLLANGTWVVPTLVAGRGYAFMRDSAFGADPRTRYTPRIIRPVWSPATSVLVKDMPENAWVMMRTMYDRSLRAVGALHREGVRMMAGSDFWNPYAFAGFGLHDELALLVEAGLEPLEALRAATLEPARYLEATDSLGSIEAGKLADLVLLEGNPLQDIRNTSRIRAVVLDGRLFRRDELDRMLAEAERHWRAP